MCSLALLSCLSWHRKSVDDISQYSELCQPDCIRNLETSDWQDNSHDGQCNKCNIVQKERKQLLKPCFDILDKSYIKTLISLWSSAFLMKCQNIILHLEGKQRCYSAWINSVTNMSHDCGYINKDTGVYQLKLGRLHLLFFFK